MSRSRPYASVVLIVLGALLLAAGTVAFFAREQVIDRQAFADRAVAALDDDAVRTVVGREIVTVAIDRGSADLVAAGAPCHGSRACPVSAGAPRATPARRDSVHRTGGTPCSPRSFSSTARSPSRRAGTASSTRCSARATA